MISIKPSIVPKYLRSSAFFNNLGEDDQELSVPKECCKLDTYVSNAAELEELLRTVRFWGVDQIPESVAQFLVLNERAVWEPVTTNFVTDLPWVVPLLRVLEAKREHRVCEAALLRNVDMVTCLLEQGYPAEYKRSFFSTSTHALNIAARSGDMDILKVLSLHGHQYQENTGRAAALCGQYACLEYITLNGCPLADDLVTFAFAGGSIECLVFLRDKLGCQWTKDLFAQVNQMDASHDEILLLRCLQYAQTHGCPSDPQACEISALNGFTLLLQRLHEHGTPWCSKVITAALDNSHLGCLAYAVENGCPLPHDLFLQAMLTGSVEIVQYLYDRGMPWPRIEALSLQYKSKGVAEKIKVCLAHAYKLGCPRDPNTCHYACKYGWYDILVDAHKHGSIWDEYCPREAVTHGHLNCLTYLHENGCPWDKNTTTCALACKNYDCLKYAIEHGCPVSDDIFSSAIIHGSVDIIQYLYDRGFPWPSDLLYELSVVSSDVAEKAELCVSHAYKLGCPRDSQTCYYASFFGWYDILVDAHQHGFVLNELYPMQAVRNGHLRCLKYLHEHGCPWDEETTHRALQYCITSDCNDNYGCMKYAVEHGCPMSESTTRGYEALLRDGMSD